MKPESAVSFVCINLIFEEARVMSFVMKVKVRILDVLCERL